MNWIKIIFLFFTCIVFSQKSKQIAFRELTVEHGLSQNSVVSIAQDSTGFMWFATQDGLNKYDGNQFKYYPFQFEDVTRSTYSKLGKIYIDRQDNVWIVVNSGILYKLNKLSDKFELVKNIQNVSTIIQDTNNNYFIGTYGSGLYHFNEKEHDTTQILKENEKDVTTYDFLESEDEIIGATSKGIIKVFSKSNYEFISVFPKTNFSALAKLKKSKQLFLGSFGNGLFVAKDSTTLSFKQFTGFKNASLPTNLIIQDILVNDDKLWVATYGDGAFLVNFNEETVHHFTANKTNPYALHYNDVLSLYEDFTGLIWLGTDGAGLSYYDKDLVKFNVLTNKQAPDNINIDFVRAITEQKGVVWLGTSNKGLTSFNLNNNAYQKFTTNNSALKSDRIMSLFTDNKNLWIGHQNDGLQKLTDGHKFEDFDETNTISIWKIYKAQNHRLWLCTLNGLLLFGEQKGIVKSYNTENSNLTSNAIRTVEAGETNTLWIGSESDGLFRLNTLNDSLVNIKAIPDRIKSLYYNNHILWVGTNGNGLKAYNTKTEKISHFTIKDGLANNVIYGILPDGNNNLWLSSNNGLTRASISKDSVVEIENFNNYDGLQTNEFNTGAYFKNNNGMLYFGGLEGLNWFNPNNLSYNTIKPKTVITNFDIFSKPHPIKQGEKFSSKQNTMTFTFSGLHYSQPDRNQYKYQLLNHDSDWVLTGNNNKAHYTNLPPGDYTFKVLSSNYDGVWSNIPATYSFTILKPWYLTNLLKILYALTVILILFGIYKYLQFRWKVKTQLQLKQAETERLKKLDEFKTKLYTNISHEFRTPLTLITGPIDHQLSKHNLEPNDRKELNLIKQNANRLLGLVNQMVDLALIDSGQAQLKIENGNLKILLIQIVSAFQYKAKEKDMIISSRIEGLENVWYDKDVIEKISSNLLANAIKYAPESSEIIFDANEQGNNLVLSVINTNKEITKKDLGKLFKRFYKDDEASEGVGVGLALVKELVSLSNGSIIANSIDLDKIQFTVTLPITKDAFKASEILNSKNTEQEIVLSNDVLNNNNKPCLLIVEDNKDIRTFVKSVFENSYQIIEASNGQAGIKKAIKHMPSLIISDIMMPIKNGIDLCNTLKHNELTSHIPIVLLTAKVGEDNELEGLKTGAEAYITKPFSSKKLKLIVEKQIENRNRLQQHFSKSITLTPEITVSSTEAEFLKRLKEVLDKNLTNPDFNTETFSVKMQMSRTQLHRKLKAIVGLSTSEFIRNERLKLAINLLKTSDNSISEIAYQIGFNTPSYFIKCFKEAYNCTPVEYSKRG